MEREVAFLGPSEGNNDLFLGQILSEVVVPARQRPGTPGEQL